MKLNKFEEWGYAHAWSINWFWDRFARLWFRYYCPRPVIDDPSAKACVRSGNCGCDNYDRYHQ